MGMICSEKELGISDNHDGIFVLKSSIKVGTPLKEIIKSETDHVFDIGLTPNRSDAMSHMGIARDLKFDSAGLVKGLGIVNEKLQATVQGQGTYYETSNKHINKKYAKYIKNKKPKITQQYTTIYYNFFFKIHKICTKIKFKAPIIWGFLVY